MLSRVCSITVSGNEIVDFKIWGVSHIAGQVDGRSPASAPSIPWHSGHLHANNASSGRWRTPLEVIGSTRIFLEIGQIL